MLTNVCANTLRMSYCVTESIIYSSFSTQFTKNTRNAYFKSSFMDDEQKKYSINLNTEAQKLKKFTSILFIAEYALWHSCL